MVAWDWGGVPQGGFFMPPWHDFLQILIYFEKLESVGGLSVEKGAVQGLGQNLSFLMGKKGWVSKVMSPPQGLEF